jgi:hypothetical protein
MIFDVDNQPVSDELRDRFNAIREGREADKWGWMVPVKQG